MSTNREDKCRHCRTPITVSSTSYAVVDRTKKEAKQNFYGGWVCSPDCDRRACLELKSDMPGAGRATSLNSSEEKKMRSNWPEYFNY